MLFALHEPILFNYTGNEEIYRFTWLRTFHNPIALRLHKKNENIRLYVKATSGAGGYSPGNLIIDTTITITINEWKTFQTKFNAIDFWNFPTRPKTFPGNDGSEWILEAVNKNKYHAASRWSPGYSEFSKCCVYLVELSKLKITKQDQY
jgi:hypothetical protein